MKSISVNLPDRPAALQAITGCVVRTEGDGTSFAEFALDPGLSHTLRAEATRRFTKVAAVNRKGKATLSVSIPKYDPGRGDNRPKNARRLVFMAAAAQ